MNVMYQKLRVLQTRLEGGDPDAVVEFRCDVLPVLSRIVRRMLAAGTSDSPLSRSIRSLANQLECAPIDDDGHSIQQIASRLCDVFVAHLGQARMPAEQLNRTVRGGLSTLTSV